MKWWGTLSCLLVTQGLAQNSTPAPQCHVRCIQVYSGHHSEFEQVNAALDSCIRGCEYFSRIEFQTGAREPLNTLKSCNYSCDETYDGSLLPACQSGCGFHFDGQMTAGSVSPRPRSDTPIPIFTRPVSSSGPPSPSPRGTPVNPFLNMFRSQAGPPVVIRRQNMINLPPLHFVPQAMSEPRALNVSPESSPRVVELNLPQLLSKVGSLLPQMSQGRPRVMEISINRNPFAQFQPENKEMNFPELPRMVEGLFGRKDDIMEPFIEDIEQLFGDDEPEDDDVEIFMEKNMFEPEESFFGHKDDDMEPFGGFGGLFGKLHSQFGDMMSSLPQLENLRGMLPFGEHSGGKLTVIKAGPGFHEEKSYNIGPDGQFTEVKPVKMAGDALEHANPMDSHFDSADAEIIPTKTEVEKLEAAPVMDVRGLEEEQEQKKPLVSVEEFQEHDLPYLSVLRNSVEEKARVLSEKILQSYRSVAEREYLDNECSSRNLSWSDWVSCLHTKVGVPRWLTAATISLGIIFSIWLCLVIPSTAPKRKVKTLLIKGEKPSAAILKAVKEAEAAAAAKAKEAEASGLKKQDVMVAVINVDLPPTYGDLPVVPGSPAPSYKSDMAAAVPASPAPSYKSMDLAANTVALEPVHEKKESNA